jgi:hypothetical protein
MCIEKRIDDLIVAGWGVLESDFDPAAFHHWRREAFHCLNDLLGPDHPYTEYFGSRLREAEQKNLLVGRGILTAAKEKMVGKCQEAHKLGNEVNFFPSNSAEPCEGSCTGSMENLRVYSGWRQGQANVQTEDHISEPELRKGGTGNETDICL